VSPRRGPGEGPPPPYVSAKCVGRQRFWCTGAGNALGGNGFGGCVRALVGGRRRLGAAAVQRVWRAAHGLARWASGSVGRARVWRAARESRCATTLLAACRAAERRSRCSTMRFDAARCIALGGNGIRLACGAVQRVDTRLRPNAVSCAALRWPACSYVLLDSNRVGAQCGSALLCWNPLRLAHFRFWPRCGPRPCPCPCRVTGVVTAALCRKAFGSASRWLACAPMGFALRALRWQPRRAVRVLSWVALCALMFGALM